MIVTEKERERRRQKRFKQEVRELELRKYWNPERDLELAETWVIYIWVPTDDDRSEGKWRLAGFRRKRRLRKRQTMNGFFAKIRRKLELDKKTYVMVRDLDEASRRLREADQSWQTRPPRFYQLKPKEKIIRTPKPKRPKVERRRATVKAYLFNKKTTKYVALGRFSWSRSSKYLYLGPLTSTTKRQAQFEARRMFPVYDQLLVIAASELSTPLRAAMARSRKVRAGVSRIVWPEVPPTFEAMWLKFAKRLIKQELHDVTLDDPRMIDVELALRAEWDYEENPWLTLSWFRKQVNQWRTPCDVPKKRKKQRRSATVVSRKGSGRSSKTTKLPPGKYVARATTLALRLKSKLRLKRMLKWNGKLFHEKSASRSERSGKHAAITSRRSRGGHVVRVFAKRKDVYVVKGRLKPQRS